MINIADCHNDVFCIKNDEKIIQYLQNCQNEGVSFLSCSFFSSKIKENCCFQRLKDCQALLNNFGNKNFVLHVEDAHFVQSLDDLKKFVDIKPFSCSLTWNDDTCMAGGCYGCRGLSEFGKTAVREMENAGIIVDVAHLNRKSFHQFAALTKNPIYCSHSCFDFIVKSKRNLTNAQIKKIVSSNGFIGLYFYREMITKNKQHTIHDVANIFVKFVEKFGCDNIGFGSDFNGLDNEYPLGLEHYSSFANLYDILLQKGLSKNSVNKIFYKNFQKFLSRIITK